MASASDVFRATLAKTFDDVQDITDDDIYKRNFPYQLRTAMLMSLDMENSRRAASGEPELTQGEVSALSLTAESQTQLPFDEYTCLTLLPLYIASENLRDAGQLDLSGYLREQFISAVNEHTQYSMTEVESCL